MQMDSRCTEDFNLKLDTILQRNSHANNVNLEMHPSFQNEKYNMPLPDPGAFSNFEMKLKNDPVSKFSIVLCLI